MSVVILISLVCTFLISLLPLSVLSLYANDTSAVSCSDRATRAIFSVHGRFELVLVLKLTLVNVRVFGWVRGVAVWIRLSPSSEPLL